MKVAVTHNHPIHYKHLLFQSLKKRGLDLQVLFLASSSRIRHEKIALCEDLYAYRIGYDGAYELAPRWRRASFVWTALSARRPDIVIIGGYYAVECWVALLWSMLYRRKRVLWFTGNEFDYPRHWPKETIKRIFLRQCHRAHVYGLSDKAYLMKLGMPESRIDVKKSVANIGLFATRPEDKTCSPGATKQLVYVGRLAPEKNVSVLLRAMALAMETCGEQHLRLIIAGSGPEEENLRRECTQLGLSKLVKFVGYCHQEDLPDLLRSADFLVLPSKREPWGLVALEAMLCRLPVIISDRCGCAGDVVTPETGWKFSPSSPKELAAILAKLPEMTSSEITRMGDAAYRVAIEHSPDNCARRVAESLLLLSDRHNGDLKEQVTSVTRPT